MTCTTTAESTSEDQVFRTDTKGRVRTPVAQREALLDEFERSGLSAMKFAAMVGVKYPTFANWLQGRRKRRSELKGDSAPGGPANPPAERPVRLFEAFAEIGRAQAPAGLRVELPGGVNLFVDSPSQLRLAAGLLELLHPARGERRVC